MSEKGWMLVTIAYVMDPTTHFAVAAAKTMYPDIVPQFYGYPISYFVKPKKREEQVTWEYLQSLRTDLETIKKDLKDIRFKMK